MEQYVLGTRNIFTNEKSSFKETFVNDAYAKRFMHRWNTRNSKTANGDILLSFQLMNSGHGVKWPYDPVRKYFVVKDAFEKRTFHLREFIYDEEKSACLCSTISHDKIETLPFQLFGKLNYVRDIIFCKNCLDIITHRRRVGVFHKIKRKAEVSVTRSRNGLACKILTDKSGPVKTNLDNFLFRVVDEFTNKHSYDPKAVVTWYPSTQGDGLIFEVVGQRSMMLAEAFEGVFTQFAITRREFDWELIEKDTKPVDIFG